MRNCINHILIPIFVITVSCKGNNSEENPLLLGLLGDGIQWESMFSYPGRDVSQERQVRVRDRIVDIIDSSREELEIHIYGLTDSRIIRALAQARDRGVRLRIVVDKDRNYSELESLGLRLDVWRGSGLHHPKVVLADRKVMFTGTGNFTTQGLLKDFDSYLLARNITEYQYKNFLDFLREDLDIPYLEMGGMGFLNSPRDGISIQKEILDRIRNAQFSIRYLIYTHFDELISHELVLAAQRGVRVEGIYDRPINPEGIYLSRILPRYGSVIYEEENEDKIDNGSFGLGGLLHHKTMIIDERILMSGSYNYSRSARDLNREIYYETNDPILVRDHLEEFQRVRERSRIYMEKEENQSSEGESKEPEAIVMEWGSGIFQSKAMFRMGDWANYLPISSGVFSVGVSARREISLGSSLWMTKSGQHWDGGSLYSESLIQPDKVNIMSNHSFELIPLFAVDVNVSEGTILRLDTKKNFSHAILWTQFGEILSGKLNRLNSNSFHWELDLPNSAGNTGLIFLREENGLVNSMSCYVLGGRNVPRIYDYILRHNFIIRRDSTDSEYNCYQLGGFGS